MAILPTWPPPINVRPILRRARQRYRRLPVTDRPALDVPTSVLTLFPLNELTRLAQFGYWPLPRRARLWMAGLLRRRGYGRRLRADLAELASAIAALEQRGAVR